MSVNDEWEKALNGYANIKWNPKQKQPKSPVGGVKKSDERYEPLVGGLINGLNGLERTAYQALGGINAQLAGWSANQQTRHTGDIERYKQSYENNPVLRKTAMTPEEYEKRRLENPSFWGQVLGGVDQKTKFTKEQAEELRQKWMLEEEKPWMDKANAVEDVRYTRMPANALEKVGVDLATNAPQLGEAALSGAALGSVLGPAGSALGAGLSMAKNIYGAAYGDERRKGRSIDASHGAAVADTLYQMPFEYVGASRIFKAIPGLRRAFGKLSPQGKSKFGEWLKTVRTEGSTEFLQQYGDSSADDIADAIETGKFQQDFEAGAKVMGDIAYENAFGENAGKNLEEAAYAGLLGGIMGGATHGAGMAIDALGRKLAGNPNITQADLEQAVDEAGQDIAQDGDSSFGNDALNFLANQTDVQLTEGQARNLAAAMAGNAFQESGYDSTVENGIGAYGSFQHLGDRKDALFNFAEENGLDPSSRQAQIAFAWKEMMTEGTLENQAFQEIMALGDNQPEAAAVIFRKLFERPGEEEANDEARMAEARRVHDRATKAREWLTNKRDMMDMDRADADSVYDTINQILTESTDEQLLEQAKAFGFREEQEKDVNDQRQRAEQSIEQNAPQETPKATPQPQGQAGQLALIQTENTQAPQAQQQPVQGMETVNKDRTAPHIDRNKANKGNFNNRGNYNGRLDAPQNKRVESPIRNQGQSAPILQQGENQNAENLQTQTTERRENRENLNENTQPQQTQTAENQATPQNPQGNEVTPTLAPSNQGTAGIAQSTPKIASNGQNEITSKVNGKALVKATEGNTRVVSGESENVGEQGIKGDIALDRDGTVSAFKKAVNGILAKLKAGNVSQTRQKLTEARSKAIIRIAERKNNKEISEEMADRLENRIDEIVTEAKETLNKASNDMLKDAFGMGRGIPSIFNKDAVEKIASNKKVKDIVDKMPKAEEEKQSKKAENNSEAKRETKDDGKKDKNPNKEETAEAKKPSQKEEKFTNETVDKKDTEKAKTIEKEEAKAPQEKPKKTKAQQKADAEKEIKTQIETLATQLNNLARKIENNDIMKEDNSNVSNKEESENVPERSAGLSGTVGMGESRSSEGEGTRNENTVEGNSKDEGGNSGRELREKSSSNAGTDEGKTERSVSDTPTERVGNGRDDSARNESGGIEPTVKVENVEKDIAVGKVKNARDTSGNDYIPTKAETENRSPKKRCEANIDAIAVLKKLETENRKATPTEQEILAGYSGWGGLSFAFDERSSSYSPETNQKLRDLLTETEYAEAKSEIISAFYTPPFVIQAMWKLANRLGFKGGRVLDPSCGVANFFTYMPTEMKGNSTALQGIDKSPIPARIAAQLFQSQKYKVDNSSYEKFARGDNFYDLAITNVPFSSSIYPVDKAVKGSYNLQDYYFAKSLQKVRPGGLIIFMTTHSTMDGTSSWQIRRELSLKTEFLGAIRLPSNLFDKAGAGVISDIVVLRKLNEGEGVNKESWGNYAKKKDKKGFEVNDTEYWKAADEAGGWKRVNNYWNEHPENVVGKVETTKGRYGGKDIVVKTENEAETQKLLDDAVNRFAENVYQPRVAKPLNTVERVTETVDPSVRYVGDIYENSDGQWVKAVFDKDVGRITGEVFPTSKQAQVGAFMAINKAQNDLMIAEVTPETTDKDLTEKRKALNTAYDKYLAKYGALNEKSTLSLVDEFPQIGRMLALENYTPPASKKRGAKGTIKKAEIFTKRVLYPEGINVKVETPEDALIASIQKFGRIDLEYMGNAIGSTQADLVSNLSDKIIKDPLDERYVLLDEYLSGNVRAKLLIAENAAETDPDMKRNVELLKKVVPKDVEITDISIPLGSPVVTQEETQEFVDHMLGVRDAVTVKFNPVAGIWDVKRGSRNGYLTHQTDYIDYGVYIDSRNRADSAKLIEACLNTTDISNWGMFKVGEEDSAEMRKAREEAQQQAQLIREKIDREFKQWIEANAEVSARVKEAYNLKFNAFAPRKYDGSILSVNTTKHTPYAHQLNGALRAIMSKATLLNHCVGSGKSLTMMIAGMEMKRMGLANKIVYALPKNVVKQFEKEFYEDFPTAKILVLSSETLPRAPRTITYDLVPKYDIDGKTQLKDDDGVLIYEKKPVTKEEEARRRAILARRNATLQKIKTNDWDAILVSHNTFENIPVSDDVLIDFYQKEIKRYEDALEQEEFEKTRRSDRKGRTARRIQELLEKYRNMLTEALEGKEKYDVGMDTFETLGIDQIFVDESDLFKNLGFLTSLSQVKGVSTTGSGRAMDMFLKTQYLLHEPSAHGVVFATGTPISNSISEAYTLCRYLAPDELERLGCNSFDQFAKLFVNIAPAEEPKLDGSGYQYKTKVVGIRNAPECFRMINQFMDTKTVEDLPYIKERLPKARRTTITVKEPAVLSKFKGGLASRIKGFKGKFGKELPLIESRSRASIEHFKETGEYLKVRDGYLKVAQDYKDITLCPYIYDSTLTGEEAFGRVWACADKAAEVYKKTTETKGTQVIFCDSSTPKKGEWSVYEELKQRLIAQGIPENEIAFVHDAGNNEAKRQEIFNAVRDGRIRILIGSTEKMGAGTNMQDRLVALHHLDAPWRPRDIEQREGRILRNGNKNKEVDIFTYVTEGSYDMNLYNLLSTKQSVFSQILHGSEDVRETDTEGVDNNNFAEIEKLANNDPTQVMYLEKQQQLRRLEAEKAGDVAAKTHAAFVVNSYGEKIARDEADLADSKKDVAEAEKIGDKFTIKILGDIYTDREKATDAFKKALQDVVKTLATEFSKETLSGRYANIADVYVQPIPIAKIGSFDISVGISQYFANNHDENNTELIIQGAVRYGYGTVSAVGAWNAIHSLPTMVKEDAEANLALDQKELEQAHATLDRKFDKDGEIEKLKKEVADLRDAINKAGGKSFSTETDDVKALTKTVQAVYEQDLTDREKGLIAFGRKMGVTVSFFTGDSRLHGWQNGDAIFLNRDMTRDVNQVFWHETFHWLKRNNPKLYEALEKAVLQNDDIAAQVKAWQEKTGRTNLTEEEAIEEMLADAMLDASTRGKFFETLGITHPTLVQKLIKWIRNTYRALVDQFRHTEGFKPEAGLTNTQIDRMSKELDKIADKLVDGNGNKLFSRDAKENLKENTVKDVQYVDGVKYLVTNKNLKDTDSVEIVDIPAFDEKEDFNVFVKRVATYLKDKELVIEKDAIKVLPANHDDRNHFAKSDHPDTRNVPTVRKAMFALEEKIDELFAKGVYVEEQPDKHIDEKENRKPRNFVQVYAAARYKGEVYRIKLTGTKRITKSKKVKAIKPYNLQVKTKIPLSAIKKGASPQGSQDNNLRDLHGAHAPDTVSVPNLMTGVKDLDLNPYVINGQLQYEPSILEGIQAEEKAKEIIGKPKFSVDLSDLAEGKVLNDALKNAMASRVQEKMEIMKESDAAHYLGKYIPKQPKARPNVSYDTNYGKKKRDKAWELLNYGVLAYIRSPSRLANPIIKQIYTWAEDAKRTQNKFYSKWTEKHKEILDLVQDAKDYAGYVDVLLTEDSDKRVFSDGELRSLGYSDKVIKAHKKVRDLLQEIRAEVAKIYQAEHVETKNFKSKAEADFWAKNPMFKNVEVKAMNKENGTVWQVKYTTPQYVERTTEVNIQLLDELKRRQQPQGNDPADVYILEWQDHQEEITGATTFTVKYLESRNKLANLDQYIPHFFHEFLVIEVKNGTRRVVGSGTTLNEAVAVANNLAAGSKAQFFIAPKGFAYEDSTQALGIVGDKDLSNLSETLKAELEVSLEEAREAVKGNSHHIFLSALQHRKGAKGWETNMRWVIQHHISNTARYCALEPFKQMAMNLFERRFGSFSDSYSGKVIPDFTKGLINSVLGVPSKAEEITNAILSCLPIFENVPRPSRAVTSSIVGAMAVLKLGVSPAAAFINLTQFVNLQGYIGSEWTLKGMNAAWNLSEADTRLLEELGTREEAGLETVDVSEETELIVGRFSKELKALKAAADKSMVLFTKAESFLRTASILGAYRKALAEGKTERAARAYALEINRNVNFNYGVEDAPRMFRALQGSVVGDMFLQFKKYGFKELEVIGDMLTNKNIPKSQKLMFFGEYFLLGGLFNSIPFQDLILALLGFALDEDDPEAEMKKWLMEFGKDNWAKRQLALIGMYGLGGAAGVDISQRVGFRSLVPEAENPFGVTGSTIAQVANALMNGDPIGMLKSTSPALGNLASAYAGHNTDSKGRVSYTYKDPFERVVRAAGFRTTGEALSVDKQRILNEDRSQREKQRKEAREAYFDNPSAENRRRLKELGYTDTQIKNLKPNDPTLERTERMRKNLSKREQKEFKEILEW